MRSERRNIVGNWAIGNGAAGVYIVFGLEKFSSVQVHTGSSSLAGSVASLREWTGKAREGQSTISSGELKESVDESILPPDILTAHSSDLAFS
jgi:hypothetical protein